jgi:hypothetical protein
MATIDPAINMAIRPYSRSEIQFLSDRLFARSISGLRCDTPAARRDYLAASRLLRRLVSMYEASSGRTLHTVMLQEGDE